MTLKRAVLITLDNPLASVFVLVVSLVFGIASVFLAIPPLVLFTAGFLAFFYRIIFMWALCLNTTNRKKRLLSAKYDREGGW